MSAVVASGILTAMKREKDTNLSNSTIGCLFGAYFALFPFLVGYYAGKTRLSILISRLRR